MHTVKDYIQLLVRVKTRQNFLTSLQILHKRKENPLKAKHFRLISVPSIISKIFERIMQKELSLRFPVISNVFERLM